MKKCSSASGVVGGIDYLYADTNSIVILHGLDHVPTSVVVTPAEGCTAPIAVVIDSMTDRFFEVHFIDGVTLPVDCRFTWMAL